MSIFDQIGSISILKIAADLGIEIKNNKSLCFIHEEKTPSLSFTPRKNLWYCFGCGEGGSNIELVMARLNLNKSESINLIKRRYMLNQPDFMESLLSRKSTKRKPSLSTPNIKENDVGNTNIDRISIKIYSRFISKLQLGIRAKKYLYSRGFSKETIKKYTILDVNDPEKAINSLSNEFELSQIVKSGLLKKRYYRGGKIFKPTWWDHTILFPFIDNGEIIYIQGRRLIDTHPKYIGLNEIKKPIYNWDLIHSLKPGHRLYICEGIPDTIMALQNNYNSIGILGTSRISELAIKKLNKFNISIVPDNDVPGFKWAFRIQKQFLNICKIIRILKVPKGNDFDEYLLQKQRH